MPTLLLMSSGKFITSKFAKLLPLKINTAKIAYITTAAKGSITGISRKKVDASIKRMKRAKYDVEEMDIEGKTKTELRKILKNKDIIFVAGGNTFYLLKAVRESGFDVVVKEALKRGVVYAGSSAGAYICCPTIEVAGWKKSDTNYVGLKNLKAMNLVPFLIKAHYEPKNKKDIQEGVKKSRYPVKILTDQQALFVDGKDVWLVGEGKEIKIK